MTLSAGERFGAYEILGVIGAGGMGVVYRAHDTRLKRDVALKLLPDIADGDARARAMLLHEARAAAALNHPSICTIHDVGDATGVPYIAMELVAGETLHAILRRRPMSPERVCRIGHQVADALEHAHAHGIIHRDFKTANVMITPDGRPKVLDFGIASQLRAPDDPTRTGTLADPHGRAAGTLAYMAPEVLQGRGADVRSDVWALGVVLHEMTSGRSPFERQTDSDLAAAILRDAPAPLPSGTPSALARIIERCLAKEPDQRPARAGEVSLALDVASPPSTATAPAARAWYRPAAMALAAVVVVAGVFAVLRVRSADPAPSASTARLANPVQVTTDVGVEQFAAWSPDGRTLAYSDRHDRFLSADVWVTQVGGGAPINRTADYAGLDEYPSWSPDGTQIAFYSGRDGGGCYVMPALSGPARKVATTGSLDRNPPQWSADGRTLSCVGSTGAEVFIDVVSLDNGVSQRQLALPGAGRRMFVSKSRDAQMYALVSGFNLNADVTQLWVLHVPSNRSIAVTDGRSRVLSPSWSPDGRWLYYLSNAGGGMDLWRQGMGGEGALMGPPQPVSSGIGMRSAAISSDGARVVYSQGRRLSNVWRVPLLPARPATWADATQLTFDQAYIEYVDVSRDGARLAVSSDRSGNQDLWALPASGGEMQRLTTDPTPEWAPTWSPDQSTLAFYAYRTGERQVYTMPATGGPWRQITDGPGTSLAPSWSWDGSKIASYGGVGGILISPVDGGPAHVMSNARASAPSFSPIDDRLLYGADSGAGPARLPSLESIWVVPVSEATAPVKIFDEGGAFAKWMPDGKSILTIVMRDGASVVVSIADDGTHERRLTNLSGRRGALWGSVATDGTFLYFIWSEDVGDLWVMDLVQAGR
jgi:eukaryotic-like serine/threonine-protein kinase